MKPHYRAVVIGGGAVGASGQPRFRGRGKLSVHIVGTERPARVIAASPYDPDGKAMRQ